MKPDHQIDHFYYLAKMYAASAIHHGGLIDQNHSLGSLCAQHCWRCALPITSNLPQGVGATSCAIGGPQVAEAIFTPGDGLAGAGIADPYIA